MEIYAKIVDYAIESEHLSPREYTEKSHRSQMNYNESNSIQDNTMAERCCFDHRLISRSSMTITILLLTLLTGKIFPYKRNVQIELQTVNTIDK